MDLNTLDFERFLGPFNVWREATRDMKDNFQYLQGVDCSNDSIVSYLMACYLNITSEDMEKIEELFTFDMQISRRGVLEYRISLKIK